MDRFWSKVDKTATCWLWTRGKSDGYGVFHIKRIPRGAHRVAYELLVGPIPEGLELDHRCRNRACVNPAHLEPVPHRVNVKRGLSGQLKNECRKGHEYTEENTYHAPSGKRFCRACKKANR